jgi:myosin protein heavy chain
MDLDALGLNSTFVSTELDGGHEPPVDRVDTSDIEGPEDFTMNMTYWMTADLPLSQIKSRKETHARRSQMRMDAMQEGSEEHDGTQLGDRVVVEDAEARKDEPAHPASPAVRPHGAPDERIYSTPASERSMQNEEKVRSFLSALPDTDMEGAITGTPSHAPRHSFLQVPKSSPHKARSLQPTVEDYDTPRKPTQETVIRHTSAIIDTSEQDAARNTIAELQSQLEQQENASRSRITELETILSYTRSELEGARTDNYRHKERLSGLEQSMEQQKSERESAEADLKAREDALETKMHDFGEEMRLQNLAKLQSIVEEFEQQRKTLEESERKLTNEVEAKGQSLEGLQAELARTRQSHERELRDLKEAQEPKGAHETAEKERLLLTEQLSSVQARADALQSSLESATAEAKAAREDAQKKDTMRSTFETKARNQTARIAELEGHLQTARFEAECAQADVAAKHQLFRTNLEINSRFRALQSELEVTQAHLAARDQQGSHTQELETRIDSLQSQLEAARADVTAKAQQTIQIPELQLRISALQTQLESAQADRTVIPSQTSPPSDSETRTRSLQSQVEAAHADLAAKEEQIARYMEAQEQSNLRYHTSQGRLQSLEAGITILRQQLADTHRDNAKAQADADRFSRDLEDANERLQDASAEADRRVMDVDKKLSKMKELKLEAEKKFKELQFQQADLIEGHEAMMEDVREKAEDAVRKAGTLLEQERTEKRRLIKDLKRTKEDVDKLRVQKAAEEEASDSSTLTEPNAKDTEMESLRDIIKRQVAEMKTLKADLSSLRKENKKFKSTWAGSADLQSTIADLESELKQLRSENSTLQSRLATQEFEHEAINKAMDEKLATVLSKLMKERAKTVVGKRDGQWVESVKEVQGEKELLGKVLMRQWGREEVGGGNDDEGKGQGYRYKYVKRGQ